IMTSGAAADVACGPDCASVALDPPRARRRAMEAQAKRIGPDDRNPPSFFRRNADIPSPPAPAVKQRPDVQLDFNNQSIGYFDAGLASPRPRGVNTAPSARTALVKLAAVRPSLM